MLERPGDMAPSALGCSGELANTSPQSEELLELKEEIFLRRPVRSGFTLSTTALYRFTCRTFIKCIYPNQAYHTQAFQTVIQAFQIEVRRGVQNAHRRSADMRVLDTIYSPVVKGQPSGDRIPHWDESVKRRP